MELNLDAATVRLNERLDEADVAALQEAVAGARAAQVLVLTGAPEQFCLGMAFGRAPARVTEADLPGFRRGLDRFADLMHAVLTFPRPTLALVDGTALGAGLGLAAACDCVIATDRARFGLPEALYGLAPAIIRPALLTRLSPQALRLLLFSGHTRSASEAAALGLVDEVVAEADLERAQRASVRRLSRARDRSVAACRRWDADVLRADLRAGAAETAAALADAEVLAALRAAESGEELPWRT